MALVVALCVINVFAIGILIDVGLYNMIDCGSAVLCCSYLYSSRAPTLYSTPIGEAPPSTAARALDEHVPLTTTTTTPTPPSSSPSQQPQPHPPCICRELVALYSTISPYYYYCLLPRLLRVITYHSYTSAAVRGPHNRFRRRHPRCSCPEPASVPPCE